VHDPFPTPFIDEVLEQVAGKESYSFTYGFSGYHQVRIVEEEKKNTTFITEWESFAYNVMPFGLKNFPYSFFPDCNNSFPRIYSQVYRSLYG
jgi:hypothetical protein